MRLFGYYISPAKIWLIAVDILLFAFVLSVSLVYRQRAGMMIDAAPGEWAAIAISTLMTSISLIAVGGYEGHSLRDHRLYLIRLLVSMFVAAIAMFAVLYMARDLTLWRSTLVIAMGISLIIMPLVRVWLMDGIFARARRRMIIIGSHDASQEVKEFLKRRSDLPIDIASMIALPETQDPTDKATPISEVGELDRFISDENADLVVIATDKDIQKAGLDPLIAARISGVEILGHRRFLENIRGYVKHDHMRAEWFLYTDGFRGGTPIERSIKRTFDIFIASLMLAVFAPLLVICAVLVKLTSKGPVFYGQERVGRGGRTFTLFKFRSMVTDAEKAGIPAWASENDPRVTKTGRFLRKTRLDELPQLFNVLLGHMSMVGPRPERPYFVDQLKNEIGYYNVRHYMKPGITGWAQVRYPYGASVDDARRKLEFDLFYIKNYSLVLDFLILLQTVKVVLFPEGAR